MKSRWPIQAPESCSRRDRRSARSPRGTKPAVAGAGRRSERLVPQPRSNSEFEDALCRRPMVPSWAIGTPTAPLGGAAEASQSSTCSSSASRARSSGDSFWSASASEHLSGQEVYSSAHGVETGRSRELPSLPTERAESLRKNPHENPHWSYAGWRRIL